ncbi:MAG: DNA mismatch repair endonuclease MutL [Lachnospiraceae bacterium]|nr:DNA mismatch repair endonuclease MutL [Lachnospiraceae bacterium]
MARIQKLDQATIDMIAAGEVVERPVSVVRELVENALDAGARAVTVEIKTGGIEMIRVTDDGSGIAAEEVRYAFEPHATSKIRKLEDLFTIRSLGFRGEALSSIAAVSKVDLTTKESNALSGMRISVYGGEESGYEEIGAPAGTTVVVRDLFFNTPARRKFLKTPRTEGAYIGDLMERMALGFPDVSFHFIRDKKSVLLTTGSGDYKELIYRIFGRDVADHVNPFFSEQEDYAMTGYLGEPSLNRGNRNHEIFFVNGRYVRNKVLSKALEEGYREYLMQHRFPFALVMLHLPPDAVDVNAHPAKTEVRFHEEHRLFAFISGEIAEKLKKTEMIPEALAESDETDHRAEGAEHVPEPFEYARRGGTPDREETERLPDRILINEEGLTEQWITPEDEKLVERILPAEEAAPAEHPVPSPIIKKDAQVLVETDVQMNLFDVRMLTAEHKSEYRILGQVFDTYWILAFRDKMYLVDQHAAHEKVNYERMMKRYHEKEMMSQLLQPPLIVTLTAQEEALYQEYESAFRALGFQAEPFGSHTFALRAVPMELYGAEEKELFLSVLDELTAEQGGMKDPEIITHRIATMACKASVKGNTVMTAAEMEALIDELLTLENPYNCPHGRPTIISMSKYEIDRKFKRIV